MSEISLEWFFQIPGLFITIGVLLILIALLVLIIGSSKARNKKEVEVREEEPNVQEVANPSETVNIVGAINDNTLNVTNVNGINSSNNNVSQINDLTTNVDSINKSNAVSNNDNIMPIEEVSANIVTPLNFNDSVEISTVENVNTPEIIPVISEPIIKKNEELVQDDLINVNVEPITIPVEVNTNLSTETLIEPVNLKKSIVNDDSTIENSEVKPVEATMATVFSQTISNNSVLENPFEFTPVEPILKSSENIIDTDVSSVIEQVTEPIISLEKKVEATVPYGGNTIDGTTMMPVVENRISNNVSTENSEIEEIL